jgi:cell volume regulation protein A
VFSDFGATYLLGSIALVVILFEGGLKTSKAMLSIAFRPALVLATLGVAVTAGLVGAGLMLGGGMTWMAAFLVGAIVAPTDAAAVAAVLRASKVVVPERVIAVLEVESGLNDPMSVFLTLTLVHVLLLPGDISAGSIAVHFLREMLGGAAMGAAGGWLLVQIVQRVRAEAAVYPALMLSGGLALFGACQSLETSGFLAVYVAGVVVGTRAGVLAHGIEQAFEAFGWIAQIGLFLMLGLLVTPHDVVPLLGQAMMTAIVLIFIARPLAGVICLKPFGFSWGETGFIGWVGLRGAVPIYLAMIPVLSGLPYGESGFSAAFAIVVLSLAVQGWSIKPVAKLMRLG